jgi:hypothetical protein
MGKCIKCKLIEASYCNPGGGERRWCKGCVDVLQNGAISRHAKTSSAQKRRADSGHLPVSLAALENTPVIVAKLGPEFLAEHNFSVDEVKAGAGRKWTAGSVSALDLTTNNKNQQSAIDIGTVLVQDYEEMAGVLTKVAIAMGVNQTACVGLNRVGHTTPRHQHTPMGVLNVLGGPAARKTWLFWRPGAAATAEPDKTLTQASGDLLWFPPAWFHQVHTVATDTVATDMGTETAPVASWVSWCLPRHLAAMAGFSMAVGSSTEGQKTTRKPDKLAVYNALLEYMGSG